jgi:hypothetical protein
MKTRKFIYLLTYRRREFNPWKNKADAIHTRPRPQRGRETLVPFDVSLKSFTRSPPQPSPPLRILIGKADRGKATCIRSLRDHSL